MSQAITNKITIGKIVSFAAGVLFILTPLLSGILQCALDGKTLADIYIPLGGWSDEITYYKQIESMVSHGIPRGYFGFNQSKAIWGPFAYWGVLPLIPYVIWGVVFGWTYTSPIYANIFFCILAFAFIYFMLHPDKKWCFSFSLFWLFFQYLNRHILSGVVEASVIQQLVFIVVIGECLLSDKVREKVEITSRKEKILLITCIVFIFFMTVVRPYYAVLYLIPFWAVVRDKNKVGMITVPAVALLSIIVFVIYKKYTCAAYFNDVILVDEMFAEGIKGIGTQIWGDIVELGKYIWYALRYHDAVGWYYIFLFVELFIMLLVVVYGLFKKRAIPRMYVVTLIGNGLILLSIMLLYSLVVGGRHILALIVVNAILLLTETHISIGGGLAVLGILCSLLAGQKEPIPYANKEYVAWLENLKAVFAEHMEVTDQLSYDNVVGMPVSGDAVTYYGYLFAVPAGMGVSIDFWEMYEEQGNIKAKYIIAHPNAGVRDRLEAVGMECVVEMDELVLYVRE